MRGVNASISGVSFIKEREQTRKEADPSLCPVLGPKRGVAKQKVRQAGEIKDIVSQFEMRLKFISGPSTP